jgi:hypothetical protein
MYNGLEAWGGGAVLGWLSVRVFRVWRRRVWWVVCCEGVIYIGDGIIFLAIYIHAV